MVPLQSLIVFLDSIRVVDLEAFIIDFFFVLVLQFLLLSCWDLLPIYGDQLVNLGRCGVFILLGILCVSLLYESSIGGNRFALFRKLIELIKQGISLSQPNFIDFLVVLFLWLGQGLPFFSELLGNGVPIASALASFLWRSFQEKSHVGIHGFGGR